LSLGLLYSPWRHPQFGRQAVGITGQRPHPGYRVHRFSQRVGQHHVRLPAQHRPSQRLGGSRHITGHSFVGNVKALHFRLAAVIAPDRGRVDTAPSIGNQLRTGRGEFSYVRANRVEQGGYRVVVRLNLQRAKLLADEVEALTCFGDSHAWMHLGAERAQLGGQRFGTPNTRMQDDEYSARRDVRGRPCNQFRGILARLAGGFQHDHPLVGKQRRTQQFGELIGTDVTSAHPAHRNIGPASSLTHRPQYRCHGALDQQVFFAQHQM
jgi:hypothetical protein